VKALAAGKANLEAVDIFGRTPMAKVADLAGKQDVLREILPPHLFFYFNVRGWNVGDHSIEWSKESPEGMQYSWDSLSHTWTNTQNHIKIYGEMISLQAGLPVPYCTCTHYTNKGAFEAIANKSKEGLELWASRQSSDGKDTGFGQGLYCVAKPTEAFRSKDDLIVNNFANKPSNFSDRAAIPVCQSPGLQQEASALKKKCASDEVFKDNCTRTCLMAKRRGSVDYGVMVRAPCSNVYNISENATPEMTFGPGRTRHNETVVPGRDVAVVRFEGNDGEIQDLRDVGPALLLAIENDDRASFMKLLDGSSQSSLEARSMSGQTLISRAAEKGQLEVVKALAAGKANLEATDGLGRTPISLAAEKGHSDVARWLCKMMHSGTHPLRC